MEVSSALKLISALVYKPDWSFECQDHTGRFEASIKVNIHYPAFQSERADAADGYPHHIMTAAAFVIAVGDCDDVALYRELMNRIIKIETHEAREFLRVQPTFWAPFHPHRIDGMRRWGDVDSDLAFGSA